MKKQEEEKFVINTDYNYKKEIINDSYMFKFKDEFLVNLSFMPIKNKYLNLKFFMIGRK